MFAKILSFIALLGTWCGIVGFYYETLPIIFMFSASVISFTISLRLGTLPSGNNFKLRSIFYCFWLLKEILLSSISVIKIAFRRNLRIQPALGLVKSSQKNDMGTVVYANSITLTPGTVTVAAEGNDLLVSALDLNFINDLQDGEMDNKIKEIIK